MQFQLLHKTLVDPRLRTGALFLFVIALLVILNLLPASSWFATNDDDDSDSFLNQINTISHSHKHPNHAHASEQPVSIALSTRRNQTILLYTVYVPRLEFTLCAHSVLNIHLRGPPMNIRSFSCS